MITQFRLARRLQRWELALVVTGCLLLATAAFWLTADMRSQLSACGTAAAPPACELIYAFQNTHGGAVRLVQWATEFMPFVAGLILGVPLVAREVEQRTAPVAWALVGSRLRWLAWRATPLLLMALVPMAVLAIAADLMAHAYFPHSDLGFLEYAGRGLPLVMRFILTLVAGVAIGALLGRVLPALLVGIAVSVAVAMLLGAALTQWVPSTELTSAESIESGEVGSMNTGLQYRTPDGQLMDAETAERLIEAAYEAGQGDVQDPSSLPHEVFIGIAASRYGEVLVRETAALGGAAILIAGVAAFVVGRRRPE